MPNRGIRAQKKGQTRLGFIRAAVELFQEKGYEETTVEEIVDRAGYSRATFFRYFGGKEDVLFADLPERFGEMFDALEGCDPAVDPFESARSVVTSAILGFVDLAPDLEAACVALWFTEPNLERRYTALFMAAEQRLAEFFGRAWGRPTDTIECTTVAAGIIGVARMIIRTPLSDRHAVQENLEKGFDTLANGFASTSALFRKGSMSRKPIAAR